VENPKAESSNDVAERPRRVIKRYSNRKLYDTKDSRYVTLVQVAEMVRSGEEVQIIDNNTKDDLTEVTLAQIIYEEQKSQTRSVPLQTLKDLLHQRTEKVLENLREGPIGRLIPSPRGSEPGDPGVSPPSEPAREPSEAPRPRSDAPKAPSFVLQARDRWEDFQARVDDRIRAMLPNITPWRDLEEEVRSLRARVEELERKLNERH
jgi:polyhydroxyalkanoate synthesis repressor PhaR